MVWLWGASLAVYLWLESFEVSLQKPEHIENKSKSHVNGNRKDCNRRMILGGKRLQCEPCKKKVSCKCQEITNEDCAYMPDVVRIGTYCSNQQKASRAEKNAQRYVNDRLDPKSNIFSTIQRQPHTKPFNQIEKTKRLVIGIHSAKIKITRPHAKIVFRY